MFKSLVAFLFLLPVAVSADTFYIENPPHRSDVSVTVNLLVKNELHTRGHQVVLNKSDSRLTLAPDAIKLGNSYILTLTKRIDDSVVYSGRLKSDSLENMDTVVARLVSGALNNVASAKNVTVDTVTDNEARNIRLKTKVAKQTYIGYGPSKSLNLDTSNSGVAFTAGVLWGIDDTFSIRAGYSTSNVSSSPADMTGVSLGGHYYLNKKQHSPYVAGLLGYTWAESHDVSRSSETESGWGIEAGVGMHFYRTASVNIATELTYNQSLFTVTDGAPGSLGAKLVVFW